jgi:hypothetical protein
MSERLGSDFYVSTFLLGTAGDRFAELSALSTSRLHWNFVKTFQQFKRCAQFKSFTGNSAGNPALGMQGLFDRK